MREEKRPYFMKNYLLNENSTCYKYKHNYCQYRKCHFFWTNFKLYFSFAIKLMSFGDNNFFKNSNVFIELHLNYIYIYNQRTCKLLLWNATSELLFRSQLSAFLLSNYMSFQQQQYVVAGLPKLHHPHPVKNKTIMADNHKQTICTGTDFVKYYFNLTCIYLTLNCV